MHRPSKRDRPLLPWFSFLIRPVKFFRLPFGTLNLIYGIVVIWRFATNRLASHPTEAAIHLIIWTLVPPLWFFVEYNVLLDATASNKDRLKAGQEVAGKMWAAILAIILYFFPGGPIQKLIHPEAPPVVTADVKQQ